MLTAERRLTVKRAGRTVTRWDDGGRRNEALDTFVGALAVRRSLPRRIERGLEFAAIKPDETVPLPAAAEPSRQFGDEPDFSRAAPRRSAFNQTGQSCLGTRKGYLR